MACRVADIRGGSPAPGVTIERVRDANALSDFARINAENWTPPARREPAAGIEVAAAATAPGAYTLSTRLTHRGIGGALLVHSLRDPASAVGATTAVLQAAPAAPALYRRSGLSEFGRIADSSPWIVSDKIYYVK